MGLMHEVRGFWEKEPCGTGTAIVGDLSKLTREWFERIEEHRYTVEPCIHSAAQFTRHRGKTILEVGVGAGTDHLQWARAGCKCYGVDLTQAAIDTTRRHLDLYGLTSELRRVDAEQLPFENDMFDLVYSWGVIHHSEHPEHILNEIRRILKPGGQFIGMMYGRRSSATFMLWVKHALLKGRPWRTFSDVIWHHMESIGTKAYTVKELQKMFSDFSVVTVQPTLTYYDRLKWPGLISQFFPDRWGWFILLKAVK